MPLFDKTKNDISKYQNFIKWLDKWKKDELTTGTFNQQIYDSKLNQHLKGYSEDFRKFAANIDLTNINMKDFTKNTLEDFYASQIKNTTGLTGVRQSIETFNLAQSESAEKGQVVASAIGQTNAHLGNYLTNLNGAKASMKGYVGSLASAATKTIALNAATMALNIAVTAGLSFGISKLIEGISYLVNWEENAQEKLNELAETSSQTADEFKDEQEEISTLINKYIELVATTSDLSTAKDELQSIQDSLIEKFGDEANGIDLVNGKLSENIKLIEEKKKAQAQEYIDENRKDYGNAKKELSKTSITTVDSGLNWNIHSWTTNLAVDEIISK